MVLTIEHTFDFTDIKKIPASTFKDLFPIPTSLHDMEGSIIVTLDDRRGDSRRYGSWSLIIKERLGMYKVHSG